jgi:hypothetical protein
MTQLLLPGSVPPERRVVRCEACGRPLTDPVARLYRRGAACRHEVPLTPRGFEVEQDVLPGMQ